MGLEWDGVGMEGSRSVQSEHIGQGNRKPPAAASRRSSRAQLANVRPGLRPAEAGIPRHPSSTWALAAWDTQGLGGRD